MYVICGSWNLRKEACVENDNCCWTFFVNCFNFVSSIGWYWPEVKNVEMWKNESYSIFIFGVSAKKTNIDWRLMLALFRSIYDVFLVLDILGTSLVVDGLFILTAGTRYPANIFFKNKYSIMFYKFKVMSKWLLTYMYQINVLTTWISYKWKNIQYVYIYKNILYILYIYLLRLYGIVVIYLQI